MSQLEVNETSDAIKAIIKTLETKTVSHSTPDTQEPRGSFARTVTEAASTKKSVGATSAEYAPILGQ